MRQDSQPYQCPSDRAEIGMYVVIVPEDSSSGSIPIP
jgi:hypothetical protein